MADKNTLEQQFLKFGFSDFKWIDPYVEPWRDADGNLHFYWHHYYDPPSETEVAVVWAELAAAEARVEEAEAYLTLLTEGEAPEDATGSQVTILEYAVDDLVQAQEALEASRLEAPMDGVVIDLSIQENDQVAAECIKFLKQNKYGSASFIPLNKIKHHNISAEEKKLSKQAGAYGFAIDLIDSHNLKEMGVAAVFGSSSTPEEIIESITHIVKKE